MNPTRCEMLDRTTYPRGTQAVWKVQTPDGPVVLKRYGRKRNPVRQAVIHIGHLLLGKSPASPRGRMRTEAACLRLWRAHGFDVFEVAEARLPVPLAGPHLVLEYAPGRTLYQILEDPAVAEADKLPLLRRFAAGWGQRHRLAVDLREPRLLHEHGTFRHVLVSGERLITFDLEIAWTSRTAVPYLMGREAASFLRSLGRASGAGRLEARLRALVEAYPHRPLLVESIRQVARPRQPLRRAVHLVQAHRRRRDPCSLQRNLEALERAGMMGS